jgi:hypothetical protein
VGTLNRVWARRIGVTTAVAVLAGAAAYGIGRTGDDGPPQAMAPGAAPTRTENEASAVARRTGRPVEVAGLRTETRQVVANADGSFTSTVYQQPVQVLRDGTWVPTDDTMVRFPDGTVGPKAATVNLRMSGGGDSRFASIERAGRRYTLSWPGKLPAPVLDGNTATYPEVLPGVDLKVVASVTGFNHMLVVKSREAAHSPLVRQLKLGLDLRMMTLGRNAAGGLRLADAGSKGTVFETPPPRMWDSSSPDRDTARMAPVHATVGRDSVTLTADSALLDAPDTVYPVYIDPFTAGTNNESWTFVDSGYPSEEYWKFDGDNNARVGYCPVGVSGQVCNSARIGRVFYVLPTSFSGVTISNAKFRVTQQHTWDNNAHNVSLYRAGSSGAKITSGTNWGNMPGGSGLSGFVKQQTIAPTGETACGSSATRNVEFDAKEALSNAAKYSWAKTTFLIKSDNEDDYHHLKRFCNNAALSVTYNRAPKQPAVSGLSMNPGGACVNTTARPYVSSLPQLKAVLSDPDTADAEPLTAEFQVNWTPAGGSLQTKTWKSSALANGATFTYNLADANSGLPSLPQNVIVQWKVRANDGTSTGPWSSDGSGHVCEFILDKTKPTGPDIDSPQYLPGDATDTTPTCLDDDPTWFPGVGRWGTFTFDSAATDVNAYLYGFDTNPSTVNKLTPATDGGPVTTNWQPLIEGPHTVNVVAVDRAGKQSDIASCTFRVAAGSGPVAEWRLDDGAGTAAAADTTGNAPATAGPGAQFAVAGPGGPADKAVRLTGSGDSYLATDRTAVVDTGQNFTVSAWARLTDKTRYQTVLSQDGSGEPGFNLGFVANTGKWAVSSPVTDVDSLGSWAAYGTVAEVGKWTHLLATFDTTTQKVTLYVNGTVAATSSWRSSWTSHGAVQIGRRFVHTGMYGDLFAGDIADVRLYDRTLVPSEILTLPSQLTSRDAYWDMDAATMTDDKPPAIGRIAGYGNTAELEPATELSLYPGTSVLTRDPDDPFGPVPLVGDGHLVLDGATGYAATTGPIAGTDGSFSVSARVLLATDCTRSMTVLSQPGAHASGFRLECVPDGGGAKWQAVLPGSDADSPDGTVTVSAGDLRPDPTAGAGQFLTVTYDAARQTVKLYVDGQLQGTATDVPATWKATAGGLQIGRSLTGSSWDGYLPGVVDEVRVYTGELDETTVQQLNTLTENAEL